MVLLYSMRQHLTASQICLHLYEKNVHILFYEIDKNSLTSFY